MTSGEGSWEKKAGQITAVLIIGAMLYYRVNPLWLMALFGAVMVIWIVIALSTLFGRSDFRGKVLSILVLLMIGTVSVWMLKGYLFIPGQEQVIRPIMAIPDWMTRWMGTAFGWIGGVLFGPGLLLFAALGLRIDAGPAGFAEVGAIIAIAWLFWWFCVPRFLFGIGLWNPFRRGRVQARRPWLAGFLTRMGERSERKKFGSGPTGGFAGLIEVLANGYREGDVFLGRPSRYLRPIGLETERHMVTVSQTGAGKSTAALVPALLLHQGSVLCVDPKGELATITARRRGYGDNGAGVRGLGQEVHILDPFRIVPGILGAAYNPFDEMARISMDDPNRAVSYAGKIAEALVTKLSERDKYWDEAAETFLRGLVLFVYYAEPPFRRTLVRVRDLLVEGDVESYKAGIKEGVFTAKKKTAFNVLLDRMDACADDGEVGAAIAKSARSIEKMGVEQMGSVLTNAQEHTAFLDTPEMRKVCQGSSFLLSDLKAKNMTVYLCLPITAVTGKEGRWLRMMVLLFIDIMQRSLFNPLTPVLLAVDEFPSLGHLEGIEMVAPVMRSLGCAFGRWRRISSSSRKSIPRAGRASLGARKRCNAWASRTGKQWSIWPSSSAPMSSWNRRKGMVARRAWWGGSIRCWTPTSSRGRWPRG